MTKARVPLAFHDRPPPTFEPTEKQWQEIGGDYYELSGPDRQDITAIVDDYFALKQAENTGTYDEALVYCLKIQKAANALIDALDGDLNLNAASRAYIEGQINYYIGKARPFDFWRFKDDLSWLAPVCQSICHNFDGGKSNGFQPRDQWRLMARRLLNWAKSKEDLSVNISKAGYGKKSPFVKFIDRLQNIFPKEYKEFNTDDALSKELATLKRDENRYDKAKKGPA